MKKNIIIYITIFCLIIVTLYFTIINNIKQNNANIKNYNFLYIPCEKGICYKKLQKCKALNYYNFIENQNKSKIERKTFKCILDINDKYKLLKLDNIFIPSILNGTFCDVVYTTYYDYFDFAILKNRVYNLNLPLTKCIRIRKYHFNQDVYFEIKYKGGTKIRTLIDEDYNILEPEKVDAEYSEIVTNILYKIKTHKIQAIFNNTYKRMSFIYKNNPAIRMTIDSNIEFYYNNIYHLMSNDILELKVPNTMSKSLVFQYIDELNQLANINLNYTNFSKLEYYYHNVIMQNNN